MAVAYSVDTGCVNNLIKFTNLDKNAQIVKNFVDDVQQFIQDCDIGTKSLKQLLKQYNAIMATTKKAEKAIITGKLNHSIQQNMCEQFDKAKKNLQIYKNKLV